MLCPGFCLSLVLAWSAGGLPAAAQENGSAAAADGPTLPPDLALLHEAEEQVRRQRYARAIELYTRLAELYPDKPAGRAGHSRSRPTAYLGWSDVVRSGPSANRVDVVLMGDGYQGNDIDQRMFDDLAARVPERFAANAVLAEYLDYHDFVRINLRSRDSRPPPPEGTLETALGSRLYGKTPSEVQVDRGRAWSYLGELPDHDNLVLAWVRHAESGNASGGLVCLGTAWEAWSVHFWAHAIAGLGDETPAWMHLVGDDLPRPNVANAGIAREVPWKHWLDAGARRVAIFEGADGKDFGAFRPAPVCVMSGGGEFCPVCREALVLAIHRYVDPIDACRPAAHPLAAEDPGGDSTAIVAREPLELSVVPMQPRTHRLDVHFFVLPTGAVPPPPVPPDDGRVWNDRRARGPLPELDVLPIESAAQPDGSHRFRFDPAEWPRGTYRVVCRVRDAARVGEETWVLADEHGLLESERGWWVRVP